MKHPHLISLVLIACCRAASADAGVSSSEDKHMLRPANGTEILSLEEAARGYFLEIAFVEANYPSPTIRVGAKDLLRDRDGLTGSVADEVIAVARQLNSPVAKHTQLEEGKSSMRKLCKDLREATTFEGAKRLLFAAEASSVERNRSHGAQLLASLSPVTRAQLAQVIAEHRKHVIVGRRDWHQAKADDVEAYKLRVCTGIT